MQQNQMFRKKAMEKAFTAEELDKVMQVTKPTGWLALLIVGVFILGAICWGSLATLSVKTPASGVIQDSSAGGQQGTLFLPFTNKESISPGMKVEISPYGYSPQEYGYLLGNVVEVSQYPLTGQSMTEVLKNDSLASIFSQSGPQVMVTVKLQQDSQTGNYVWTTEQTASVSSGTLLQANIIVDEKKPIELLLPSE